MPTDPDQTRKRRNTLRLIAVVMLFLGFWLPILFVHVTAEEPTTRRIHIDEFRYGMQPEIIHVNRGDRIILTLSARDTAHSLFLQEYDFDAKVTPNSPELEVVHPSDPEGDPEAVREVVFTAGRPGLMGFFNTRSKFRDHVFSGDMHGFEQGIFVVHPNYVNAGTSGLVITIPLVGLMYWKFGNSQAEKPVYSQNAEGGVSLVIADDIKETRGINLFQKLPFLRRIVTAPGLVIWIQVILAILTYAVVLISLLGTTMAGGNLGILLVWVVWLTALIVVLVPLGGRLWCTVCPLPSIGDALQRGTAPISKTTLKNEYPDAEFHERGTSKRYNNPFRGLMLPWPEKLANVIPRTIMFLSFGTVSILIISQPRWSGWAIVLLILMGTILPLIFELRVFCRYLCPINSFISLYSSMAGLSLRANKHGTCERCLEKNLETCRWGNDEGFACPYGLSVSELNRNNECGLCLECIKSCSFKNITLRWRPFGLDRTLAGVDEAWQATVMLTLAIVYLITFQGPWHSIRDMVNIVDAGNWDLFAVYSLLLWLLALGIMPGIMFALAAAGRKLSHTEMNIRQVFVVNSSALVPLGLFVWISFAIPMFLVEGSFMLSTASDPLGWGWDLFGTAGQPWWQIWPESIPWIQSAFTLIGFALALKTLKRSWIRLVDGKNRVMAGMLPSAVFLTVLTFGLIWFYTG